MVYYFSGTGNSRHVAECIAKELGEEALDMAICLRNKDFCPALKEGERLGFVCATHFWGLPALVEEFLERVQISDDHYLYFVATYGTTTGQIGHFADRIIQKKGKCIDALLSVRMPDTWTPIFNLSDKAKVDKINAKADEEINKVIAHILANDKGNFMRHRIPRFLSVIYHLTYKHQRQTSNFHVEMQCTGCGKCAKECPVGAISISKCRPTWTQPHCTLCLHCLHSCPKFAIQYGEKTKKHGQYLHN